MIIGIHAKVVFLQAKQINTEFIKILSAIGSHNLPKLLIHLLRLAK
jgi:hypothetical protein